MYGLVYPKYEWINVKCTFFSGHTLLRRSISDDLPYLVPDFHQDSGEFNHKSLTIFTLSGTLEIFPNIMSRIELK